MSASREELLVFGYIKEYHKSNNIELPPNDIVLLFVSWIRLRDTFDKNMIPKEIIFHPEIDTKFNHKDGGGWASLIGTIVVEKGIKQSWKFKTPKWTIIGIIDEEIAKSSTIITDFTNLKYKGYGIQTGQWGYYHRSSRFDGSLKQYVDQFEAGPASFMFTMELDMTQTQSEYGVLKYIIHAKPRDGIKQIRTDGEYTNIAYDNINIDRKYRLGVAITVAPGGWIELLQ